MTSTATSTIAEPPAPVRIELGPNSYVEWLHVDVAACARRAVAYVRLSSQTATNRDNLGSQLDYCHGLAKELDAVIVAVVVEYGVKAFGRATLFDRPGMVELVGLIQSDDIDVALAFQQERLSRDDLEIAQFKRYCREAGVTFATKNGVVDPDDETADAMSTFLAGVAKLDSAVKRRRAYSKGEQLAAKGMPGTSGGIRPFGFLADRMTHEPVEARAIETAVDEFLNSVSLREIARRWNAAELFTPTGREWTPTTVRQVLRSHRIAGQRLHRRTGIVSEAQWQAIVDRAKFERVQQLLDDPARRTNGRQRSYLLSGGLLHCGACGTVLISRPYGRQSIRRYICAKDRGGCGKVTATAEHVETRANELVRTFLAEGEMPGVVRFSIVTESNELAEVQAGIARATDAFVDGLIDRATFERQQRRLLDRERTLRAAVVRAQVPEWLKARGETAKRWDSLDEGTRRGVIAYCVDHFVIQPVGGKGGEFDVERVVPQWSARTR